MNENVDLTKILKNCPADFELYSPVCGYCVFEKLDTKLPGYPIVVKTDLCFYNFTKEGYFLSGFNNTECLLFPSKDQRDWSKFTAPWYKKGKFDPKTLQPFDKVLIRIGQSSYWRCGFFSNITNMNITYKYITLCGSFDRCIPYNDDTKHLIGTKDEAPEYYRYWED